MIEYMSAVLGLVQENALVGYLPTEREDIIKRFIVYLIGRYMGASPKKGDSYSWVPNHLQDANGDLAPRSFLKCYACAAKVMLQTENHKTQSLTALLTASSIQGAVQEVSADRVAELKEDFPWLENLKAVQEGETLLMSGADFRKKMKRLLDWLAAKRWITETEIADLIRQYGKAAYQESMLAWAYRVTLRDQKP